MAYQALYRQWRPRRFADVVGQDAIIQTLRRQVETGRIAHAYLFSGTRGTGKTSTAQILASAINCLQPVDGEPCGVCQSCVALAQGASLDVEEIDAASNNGVDEIRSLRDKIRYPPQVGRYRVYIVDEVHMLSTSAFNALLKTLEEPPPHAVMILATTEPQRLPATILSRCQRFDFKRILVGEIVTRIALAAQKAEVEAEDEALRFIARASEGGLRDALSLLDVCIAKGGKVTLDAAEAAVGTAGRAFLWAMNQALIAGDAAAAFRAVDGAMREGRDAAVLTRDLCAHLRDAMLALALGEEAARVLEIAPEEARALGEQARQMGEQRCVRALDLLSHVEPQMRWAVHPRTLLELALARICRPEADQDLDALLQRIQALEEAMKRGVAVAPANPAPASACADNTAREAVRAAPPVAAPEPTPALAVSDGQVWKAALASVRKGNIPLYQTALRRARLEGMQGGIAVVAFEEGDSVFADMLKAEKNLSVLADALGAAAGRPIEVKVVLSSGRAAQAEEPSSRADRFVEDAIALFGRDMVQIVERSEDE